MAHMSAPGSMEVEAPARGRLFGPANRRCTDPVWALSGLLALGLYVSVFAAVIWATPPPAGEARRLSEVKSLFGEYIPPPEYTHMDDAAKKESQDVYALALFARSWLEFCMFCGLVVGCAPFCSFGVVAAIATVGSWLCSETLCVPVERKRQLVFFAWAAVGVIPFGFGPTWTQNDMPTRVVAVVLLPVLAVLRLVVPSWAQGGKAGVREQLGSVLRGMWKTMTDADPVGTGWITPPILVPLWLAGVVAAFFFLPLTMLSFVAVDVLYETQSAWCVAAAAAALASALALGKFSCDLSFWLSSASAGGGARGPWWALCSCIVRMGTVLRLSVSGVLPCSPAAGCTSCGEACFHAKGWRRVETHLALVQSALRGSDFSSGMGAAVRLRSLVPSPIFDHAGVVCAAALLGAALGALTSAGSAATLGCGPVGPLMSGEARAVLGAWIGAVVSGCGAGAIEAADLTSKSLAAEEVCGAVGDMMETAPLTSTSGSVVAETDDTTMDIEQAEG